MAWDDGGILLCVGSDGIRSEEVGRIMEAPETDGTEIPTTGDHHDEREPEPALQPGSVPARRFYANLADL